MAQDQVRQHVQVGGAVVQCRDVAEILAAGREETIPIRHGDLLQGLQAVCRKAGTDDMDLVRTFPTPPLDDLVRVGS
jgi:hypothetical protein